MGFNNFYFVNFFNLLPFPHKTFKLETYLSMVSLYKYVKAKVNTNLRPMADSRSSVAKKRGRRPRRSDVKHTGVSAVFNYSP